MGSSLNKQTRKIRTWVWLETDGKSCYSSVLVFVSFTISQESDTIE